MHGDDQEVGKVLNRRELLALLGLTGVGVLVGHRVLGAGAATPTMSLPACVVRPAQTEGPYFVDQVLQRSDIRTEPSTGTPTSGAELAFAFTVSRVTSDGCTPLAGAQVDVWQCDAAGVYSGVRDPGFDSSARRFLRGSQPTDANGVARFTTIYPGWYPGRTVHIHFKIRTSPSAARGHEFTSQVYFDDALTDRIHARAPYSAHQGRRTRNADDGIFRRGGESLMLDVTERAGEPLAAMFELGLSY